MARLTMHGSGDGKQVSQFLKEKVEYSGLSCQLVEQIDHRHHDYAVTVLIFEKFFYRAQSRASLTVVVEDNNGHICVDAVGSASGTGIFIRFSWGTDKSFINVVERALKELDFVVQSS